MHQVHMVVSSLGADVAHLVQARGNGMEVDALRREVRGLKVERADLDLTVLALTTAVTGLMEAATTGPASGGDHSHLEARFAAYDAAVK